MQFRAWQLVTFLVLRMPPGWSYFIATVAGTVGYYCWPRGRRATIRNFRYVLRGHSADDIRATARRSLVNYCHYLVDFVRFPSLTPAELVSIVDGDEAFANLDKALEHGKGAIVVAMHFGNWDLGAGATAARGYPLAVVAETFPDPRLDAMVVGAREKLGMHVVKMEKTAPSLIRNLRKNGVLALLIDRPVPGEGVPVTFFGRSVEVPAGPARLALRTGACLVPTAFVRKPKDEPGVRIISDFTVGHTRTGDEEHDIRVLTQEIMTAQENFIRRFPEQWYMFREMWARTAAAPV